MSMLLDSRNLIVAVADERIDLRAGRLLSKLLASSILRTLPLADLRFLRVVPPGEERPLFKLDRTGITEVFIAPSTLASAELAPWDGIHHLPDASAYDWILFLGSGSIALRGLDHLLAGDADVLWAPVIGLTATDRFEYLGDVKHERSEKTFRSYSRPGREIAAPCIFAARGHIFPKLLAEWNGRHKAIERNSQEKKDSFLKRSWNCVLAETDHKVMRFEKGEIQFPAVPNSEFLRWYEAALLNVREWPLEAQVNFIQALYYGKFFGDPSGLFLEILEP